MATLASYISDTRDFLHDPSGAFWTDAQLTSYVNRARNKVVWFTKCNRVLQSLNTVAGQESYSFTTFPQNIAGNTTLDILNVTVINGTQRYPLAWMVYSQFNAYLRTNSTRQSMPTVWTLYGQNNLYLGYLPDQVYAMEIDSVVGMTPLVLTTDIDPMLDPYTSPVPYYAASLAFRFMQQMPESESYDRAFMKDIEKVMFGVSSRRLTTPYTDRR